MAFFRCVVNVLVKGYFKESNVLPVGSVYILNSLKGAYNSSWTQYESKIVREAQHSLWGCCAFLSARIRRIKRIHPSALSTCHYYSNSAGCSSSSTSSEDKTNSPASSVIKHNFPGLSYANQFNPVLVEDLIKHMDGDMPVTDMPNPFEKEYRRCFLCRNNIVPDHKNVRLLSQFVSPYTGRIYGRAITGLCIPMQNHISKLIHRARVSGFMPIILKDPKYLQDPQPYDVMSKKSGN